MSTYLSNPLVLFALAFPALWGIACGIWKFMAWLSEVEEEPAMEEKPKQFRKHLYLKPNPPALIRIKELGWRMCCGHHPYCWNSVWNACEQCVAEGRVVIRDKQ